jgi:acetate kinase
MRILVLNSGSSSLKFRLFQAGISGEPNDVNAGTGGIVSGIGETGELQLITKEGRRSLGKRPIADSREAIRWLFEVLGQRGEDKLDAVGHRVVHGGEEFRSSLRIDPPLIKKLEALSDLAPLHNPACIAGIRGAQAFLGPAIPMVAVFDTAFHQTMPACATTYAIPPSLAARHGIRRYGFHGIAHASLAEGYAACIGRSPSELRLITLQLGNGCSMTAIRYGRSVDTSMGFTPLEGLVMGTRSGDVDPAIVPYLAHREAVAADVVEQWLNERSGLLGLSGLSRDMRTLLEAEAKGHAGASQAIELFCYRARKYLAAYLAVLGGVDAVIFGGGIGEQAPSIRARICEGMDWCGLVLDRQRNQTAVGLAPGQAAQISADASPQDRRIAAYVVAADEETFIARDTARVLKGG